MLTAPFSEEHAADPFGDWPQWRRDMGLGPHRGQDWNGLEPGTPIPASGAGTVTLSQWNGVLGWEVVVYYPSDEVYIGYCHLYEEGPPVGTQVTRLDTVGRLGNTGSASTGAHLHMTASRSNGDPGTVNVIDPMQFMSFASLPAYVDTPIIIDESEEDEMKPFLIWKKNPNGTRQWAQVSGDLARMVPIWKLATANALGKVFGAAILVDQSEWDGYVNASVVKVEVRAATEPDEN